jgi:hypothetical protein
MNSMSGIVNRPATIQLGSDRRPVPSSPEEVRTEANDTPLVTPDRQEGDAILINRNLEPIGGRVGNVVVGRNGAPLKNVAGGPLVVMASPVQGRRPFTNHFQPPNR